ncbi:GH15681 [Drosophila grimshawi]|uniref:GH15681 n=1 Tax=Drosophila grimshawi TaxID=7222 RepID=B4IZN7_DROGR|nr:GH15681 [Drosophila grimshawi]
MKLCRFTNYLWLLLLLMLMLQPSRCIELSTDYAIVSKAAAVATTTASPTAAPAAATPVRSFKGRVQTTTPRNSSSKRTSRPLASSASDEPQQELVALSSKSYISGPTTQPSKLAKRAGLSLQKKFAKDVRNRSSNAVERNRLQHDVPDHVPDSSGYVPQRIGHPVHLDYGSTGVDSSGAPTGSAGYHAVPFDGNKWHEEYWEQDYNGHQYTHNSTRVQHIEAECQDDYMKIRIGFNGSFSGLLYSAGYAYDPDCMYINGSGRDYYEFYIQLNRCGTLGKNSLQEESRKNPTNFMWNTVTVQYNPLIEEEYDEHFKVTCEYGYDFWKTVTFPFLDVEVATGNPVVFTLSPPECYMEIQNGYGIGGPRVTGPVRVGDPLTLIIYMRSKYDGFDIVVNDCYAHNGANKRIQLIDQQGCPVDDKLISRFRGSWSDSGVYETQVYAYMKTFRFTGSPALYIECDVRMCHGRCPSQPCHWRNLKAVTKRDTSNMTATNLSLPPLADAVDTATESPALSENVNLFQSLRVLQEGESDGDDVYAHRQSKQQLPHQTCLKTSTFSALTASCSALLCVLTVTLFIACSRLKRRKQSTLYDSYIAHKGQID